MLLLSDVAMKMLRITDCSEMFIVKKNLCSGGMLVARLEDKRMDKRC